ncbi:MAG: NapC/NirT family cytochrome c, partial [Thermodesulfobacteriota bacterium]
MFRKLKHAGAFYIGIGALVFLLSLGGIAHYSESPGFCNSCHIMGPYFAAWKASKHNKVACVECHYPPSGVQTILWKKFQASTQVVKYITRTYSSKPFAEVEDASCLRSGCHSERLLDAWIVDKVKRIRFNHASHLTRDGDGRQLRCVSCHSQVTLNKHIEVNFKTCSLCHFKGRASDRDLKPLKGC